MGVKLLNSFLASINSDGVERVSLETLRGKKIAVDTSIYLYRFKATYALIENMYLLCSILRHYDISPIFVFDGETPAVKQETVRKRELNKQKAEKLYSIVKKELEQATTKEDKDRMERQLSNLRNKIVRVTRQDREKVKELLDSYGMCHITASEEADALCSAFTKKGHVYACLSEDTDMFAYGSSRVLKYLSLLNHTVMLYDTKKILSSLDMTQAEFRDLCAAAGTDYGSTSYSIFSLYGHFDSYKQSSSPRFLDWLAGKHIDMNKYHDLNDTVDIYNTAAAVILKEQPYRLIQNGAVDTGRLESILEDNGFIFI